MTRILTPKPLEYEKPPAAAAAAKMAAKAAAPIRKMVRIGKFSSANCMPVAVRNMRHAVLPATRGLVTERSLANSEGPSDNMKDVAEMPGANTAIPRAKCVRLAAVILGMRRRRFSDPLLRFLGRLAATLNALIKITN
ncbi:hypothetical protein KZ483_15225 [Paenibacillus sp. sptzw28]|nr:hypothetical protein [Paenibacillus sp. sptzw28]QYR24403.1 hypothetical protein KZ483_15225 [Paenibacillus sp. sptzw28]